MEDLVYALLNTQQFILSVTGRSYALVVKEIQLRPNS